MGVEERLIRDLLKGLKTHKSVLLDGIHPRALGEVADIVARPLSMSFEKSYHTIPYHTGLSSSSVSCNLLMVTDEGRKLC